MPGLAPAVGRAAGVEDLEAVEGALVQRDVRVAEDDGVGVGEAGAQALEATGFAAGVVGEGDAGSAACTVRSAGSSSVNAGSSTLPWTAATGGPSASSSRRTATVEMSPACRIRSAARSRATQPSGSRRAPRGRWVSEMIATTTRR